ncbi:hypothetical protein EDD15DRAFT_442851 [Pisolithus albus]|nr:hypothetical protein EDD15DRAFT_442851 [Pisolithus albus]
MRSSPEAPPTLQGAASPSLVSSLQKIHGLSRKKVYGTQTSRQPFCREEPVRAKYRQAPTPLSIPAVSGDESGLNKGGVGRMRSPERASSPSDPISPARRSPRHRRGISPTDMKSIPTTLTVPLSNAHAPPPATSVHPESSAYMSMASSSSTFQPVPVASHMRVDCPGSGFVLATPETCVPSQQPISSASSSNAIPRYTDAGDAPFLFSPELEAATAAKLQAALQCSSFGQPSCMPGNNYVAEGVCTSDFLLLQRGSLILFLSHANAIHNYHIIRHKLCRVLCPTGSRREQGELACHPRCWWQLVQFAAGLGRLSTAKVCDHY